GAGGDGAAVVVDLTAVEQPAPAPTA
ncbi:MAG: hypothetical protein AVDCRST_MAG66-1149, partial [uncultured Pseudonocardia sp.]